MTGFTFGKQTGKSKARYEFETYGNSNIEVTVGDQHDESVRDVLLTDRPVSSQPVRERRDINVRKQGGQIEGRELWVKGSFFLVVMFTMTALIAIISMKVSWYAIPLTVLGGIGFTYLVALALLPQAKLSEKGLLHVLAQFSRSAFAKSKKS
jgi:hypothetical protein